MDGSALLLWTGGEVEAVLSNAADGHEEADMQALVERVYDRVYEQRGEAWQSVFCEAQKVLAEFKSEDAAVNRLLHSVFECAVAHGQKVALQRLRVGVAAACERARLQDKQDYAL